MGTLDCSAQYVSSVRRFCSGIWRYVPSGPSSRVGSLLGSHPRYNTQYVSKNIFVVLCTILAADMSPSAVGQGQCSGPGVAKGCLRQRPPLVTGSCVRERRLRRERGEGKGISTPGTAVNSFLIILVWVFTLFSCGNPMCLLDFPINLHTL